MKLYDSQSIQQAADCIRAICAEYNLHGTMIHYTPCTLQGSNRNRTYIIAGTHPSLAGDLLPRWVNPESIIRSWKRNNKLFYPHIWAFDLTADKNDVRATEELVEYLKKAEFIHSLYAEYGLDPPEKLRRSEVHQLIDFCAMRDNLLLGKSARLKCQKELDWFFRRERSRGLRSRWLNYFRSDRFPDNKGPIAKLYGFFRGKSQKTTLQQLMEFNEDIHKLEIQEHEYIQLSRFLNKVYPEVSYAVSEKEIVNHGGVGNPAETVDAIGRRVTGEEFAAICRERFAAEGWSALSDLKPAYWEFRDLYFKACDEPLVAAAYHNITLDYARCDPLVTIAEPHMIVEVPVIDFMNFVSLAKSNNLRFYIDNTGDFATASLETIHVICGEHQREKVQGILARMLNDKVGHSHLLSCRNRPALSSIIRASEHERSECCSNDRQYPNRNRS